MVIDKVYTASKDNDKHVALGLEDGTVLGITDEARELLAEVLAPKRQQVKFEDGHKIRVNFPESAVNIEGFVEGVGEVLLEESYPGPNQITVDFTAVLTDGTY